MAGIGFELKKIYRKENISNFVMGAAYSSMVTVGPTMLIVAILIAMYTVLGFNQISIASRELLSSTILYIFIFCGILSSPFNSVFSRYIADKIYQRKSEDILPSYYSGMALVCFLGTLMSLPVIYSLYVNAGIDIPYIIAAYVFWISIIVVFFSAIYLQATKDYKIVFLFYLLGMSISFLISYFLRPVYGTLHALIYGLAAGFFIIAFLQFAQVKRWFKSKGTNYTECLKYLWIHKKLFIANGFYTLGIYSHIFIFWFSEGSIVIAKTFLSHPAYDMATCIAMFSNITTTIIFIVMAETQFHDEYQLYMQAIIGGTYRLIDKNKNILFRTLAQQILRLVSIQSMITAVIFLLAVTFLPRLYFSSTIIDMYPVLSVGYFLLFLMYCLIIYLYYFNDQRGCVYLSTFFLTVTIIATFYTREMEIPYFGLGFVIGSLAGFTFGFFRIRYLERTINKHLFCDKLVIKHTRIGKKENIVYRRQ